MNKQYMVSIKSEVLLEAYADALGELSDLLRKRNIDTEDTSNVWARMYQAMKRDNQKILKVTTDAENNKLLGKYLMVRELLDGEANA